MSACELCSNPGGDILWQDACCRVVRVGGDEGAAFPGFCRVIWQDHVSEMSDLTPAERQHFLDVVNVVETAIRRIAKPDKINLASLGNMVPHLHWHVIPRWRTDSHFPAPVWAAAQRQSLAAARPTVASPDLKTAIAEVLGAP